MKGDLYPSEQAQRIDPATGRIVHQMTSSPAISHPSYFLQRSFTADDRTLVFTSYRDGGVPQLFEVDFPGGPIRQLTSDPAAIHPFSPALLPPGGERVVVVRGGEIWLLDRRTLDERLIVAFENAQLGECSFSSDGEWLTAAIKQNGQPGLVAGRVDGSEWRLFPFPRTVIHPQFHPSEPEWIEFAGDPAPRMHRIRRDGTGLECLYQHDNNEFVVHEAFLGATGDLAFVVWPFAVRRLNWATREISTIADCNAWHITPNRAGTHILYDTNHPDRGLFLLDVATGIEQHLCLSEATGAGSQWRTSRYALAADFAAARSEAQRNLSWMEAGAADTVYGPQWTHPHPSFSPSESLVAFASDRSGVTQVFVVDTRAPQR